MFTGQTDKPTLSKEATAIAVMYASWAPTYHRLVEGTDIYKYTAAHEVAGAVKKIRTGDDVTNILDLATGTGAVVEQLRSNFKNAAALGLDISEAMMEKSRFSGIRLNTALCDIERMQWPVADKSVDVITCAGALSMIFNLDHVLEETHRTLKDGGHAVMSFHISTFQNKGNLNAYQGFKTFKRTTNEMEDMVEKAGFTLALPTHTFEGYSGTHFKETHGLIAFTR